MREKRNILISIGLGAVLGWTLGFLRLPYLEKNYSFLLGFIACLSIVLIGLLIIFIWKKNAFYSNLLHKNDTSKNTSKSYSLLWVLVSTIIVVGGLASSFLFFKQNEFSKNQIHQVDKQSAEQLELIASTRKSNALVLMNSLFEKIDKELKNNPEKILSDQLIERIAALNYSFEPYRYFIGNQLSEKKWSPERGQLLLMLAKTNIDSSSFNQIKQKTSFLGADLRGANLTGADLSNTDLRGANFNNAILTGANLSNTILEKASLQKTNLEKVISQKTNFKHSDIRWSNLHLAEMIEADLSGANLSNTNLKKVNLTGAILKWANLNNAFLNEANLTEANLVETDMTRANLEKTNFTKANSFNTILNGASLNETILTETNVLHIKIDVENWLEKLDEWQVIGRKEIQKNYKVDPDISPYYKYKLNRIKK